MRGAHRRLPHLAFLHFAVAQQRIDARRAVLELQAQRHADGDRETLAERAGAGFGPRQVDDMRMALERAAQLAQRQRRRRRRRSRTGRPPRRARAPHGPCDSTKRSRAGSADGVGPHIHLGAVEAGKNVGARQRAARMARARVIDGGDGKLADGARRLGEAARSAASCRRARVSRPACAVMVSMSLVDVGQAASAVARAGEKIRVENDFGLGRVGARRAARSLRQRRATSPRRSPGRRPSSASGAAARRRGARRHVRSDGVSIRTASALGSKPPCVTSASNSRPAPHMATRRGASRRSSAATAVSAARLRARAEHIGGDQRRGAVQLAGVARHRAGAPPPRLMAAKQRFSRSKGSGPSMMAKPAASSARPSVTGEK